MKKEDAFDLKFNESCYNQNEKSSNEENGNDESNFHGETAVDDEEISKRVNQLFSDYSENDLDDSDVYLCVKCNNLYREQKDDESIEDDQRDVLQSILSDGSAEVVDEIVIKKN